MNKKETKESFILWVSCRKIFQKESDEYDKLYDRLKKEFNQLEVEDDGTASWKFYFYYPHFQML